MTSDTKSLKLRVSRSTFISIPLNWRLVDPISNVFVLSNAAYGVANSLALAVSKFSSLVVILTRDLLMLLSVPKLSI